MKKITNTLGALGIVGCAIISSPLAVAADSGWYGGLNIGQSKAKIDDARITAQLLGAGSSSISDQNKDLAYKIFGGYEFNKNFALEGGYFNLGKFGYNASVPGPGTLSGNIKLQGLNFDAVGMLPFADKYSAFGRFGVQYAQAKDAFSGSGAVTVTNTSPGKNEFSYKLGVGVQYDLTKTVGLRGEWERHRINDAVGNNGDVSIFSLGMIYRFGEKTPAPVKKAATPAPVAAAAPLLIIVPIVLKTEQYCSILDIQFEINQDDIQREEKEKLAVLGTFMKKYPKTTAVIEGHSDDVGSSENNLQLSLKRAESVVSYLVDGLHIAPSRLTAVGYGETRPIADNSTEEGKRMNRRIDAVVACATDIEGLKVIPARLTMAMEMEFDNNKTDIKPQYDEELGRVANFLKANPSITATVEGHTSNLVKDETHEMGMEMAQHRAQNVVNYLVDKLGVSRSQLSTAAFGETRRFAYNTSLEGQQENRRINIIFNYPK